MALKKFTVLSIEDNEPDFLLIKRALNEIPNISLNIININNGEKALDFIYQKNEYHSSPTPDIIILDINLPLINGKEILKTIKKDKNHRSIPVIIFSSSENNDDIQEVYELYANSYISKTFDVKDLFKNLIDMGNYWLKTNKTPKDNNLYFLKNENQ
jgi:CheY-like chemotaxis protein